MSKPENFVVLIDSREQHPLGFNGCTTERTTLATGDYSCICDGRDLREIVSIERKSVSDLLGCIGGDRERFERELTRLADMRFAALVIEGSIPDLLEAVRSTQLHPRAMMGSVLAWTFKYRVAPIFCSGRPYAAGAVLTLLKHAARYVDEPTPVPINLFERALMCDLRPVKVGLAYVADTLEVGREKHPDDDGFREPASFHIDRAKIHLAALAAGDTSQPHLSHATCRLLMALEHPEEEPTKSGG